MTSIKSFCTSLVVSFCLAAADGDFPRQWFLNAHNCYPAKAQGKDRLERARRAGLSAIEVDLAWSEPRGRAVVSHEVKQQGNEPTLEEFFFLPLLAHLRQMPRMEPGILLLLDFKSAHVSLVREVHALLSRYRELLTNPGRRSDPPATTPLRYGPLTVLLTGDNSALAQFEALTTDQEVYLAIGNREPPERKYRNQIADYFAQPATAFFRVFNFEWVHIEKDPNPQAGAFTRAERARLQALVKMAHQKGYWLRAWTLNATSLAWGPSKNFGSRPALLERWRAAQAAGVESIATDEYELAGEFMRTADPRPRQPQSPR